MMAAMTVNAATATVYVSLLAVPSTQPVLVAVDVATGAIDWSFAGASQLGGLIRIDGGIAIDEASGQLLVCGTTGTDGKTSVLISIDSHTGKLKHTVDLQFSACADTLRVSKRYGRIILYDRTDRRVVAMPLDLSDGDI